MSLSAGALLPGSTRRKVGRRLLPFVFVLYIIAYLDRANVGFAKLAMTADLGFSEAVFGLGSGIFFLGYFLLEIPGALKWSVGARGSGWRESWLPGVFALSGLGWCAPT